MRIAAFANLLLLPLLAAPQPATGQGLTPDPRVQQIVAGISEDRMMEIIHKLVSFETRHALSSDQPNRGIRAAEQWMLEELRNYSPRLQVSFDTHQVPQGGRVTRDVELRNVMAVLPGRTERRIYISGHHDSLARGGADGTAPGANDDASGVAVAMELARVAAQSGLQFDATLVFIGFSAEEIGLVGARRHAARAREEGWTIDAVLNHDMVGNIRGGNGIVDAATIRVFSAGPEDSPSRQLARYVQRQAALYMPSHRVRLIARNDRFGRGGDHTPFEQAGFAAVRFTESKEDYSRQHTVRDTPDGVDPTYLGQNARINAATAISLALAPAAPRAGALNRGGGYDARLRWTASPGAVGYRVFWREAWGPDWQHVVDVGNVTEFLLPDVSIDDYIFGVAAIGPDGNESLVSAFMR